MSDFLSAPSPPRRPPARRGSDASGISSASGRSFNNPASSATETVDRRVQRRIDVCGRLGRGAYGIVWKGIERRGKRRVVALKKCFNAFASSSDAQRIYREVSYLLKLRGHVNVVQLRHVIRAKHDLDVQNCVEVIYVYLVFEYMETDLHAVIRADLLEDVHKKYIAYQLLKALKYIHSAGVVHRDIKPSNMLLNSNSHMKLCDFGLCRSARAHAAASAGRDYYVATRWYRAPELLLGSRLCSAGIDMWATGCIVGEMYHGTPVFPGASTADQLQLVFAAVGRPTRAELEALGAGRGVEPRDGPPPRFEPEWLAGAPAAAARPLVARLLRSQPEKRATAEKALAHAWLAEFHSSEEEPEYPHGAIRLPLDDDALLSPADYRDRLAVLGRAEFPAPRRAPRLGAQVQVAKHARTRPRGLSRLEEDRSRERSSPAARANSRSRETRVPTPTQRGS